MYLLERLTSTKIKFCRTFHSNMTWIELTSPTFSMLVAVETWKFHVLRWFDKVLLPRAHFALGMRNNVFAALIFATLFPRKAMSCHLLVLWQRYLNCFLKLLSTSNHYEFWKTQVQFLGSLSDRNRRIRKTLPLWAFRGSQRFSL